METYLIPAAGIIVILALALIAFGRTRRKAEALTTDALLKTAVDSLAVADKLTAVRARALADDQAALQADIKAIADARARISGVTAPAATVTVGTGVSREDLAAVLSKAADAAPVAQ